MIEHTLKIICISITLACASLVPAYAQADQVPLEAYGALPDVEDVALSPSGNRLAVLRSVAGERMIIVMDESLKPIFTINVEDSKVRSFDLITDDVLLMQRSTTEDLGYQFRGDKAEIFQAFAVAINQGTSELIFDDRAGLLNTVAGYYGTRMVDGTPTAFFGAIELMRGGSNQKAYIFKHGRPSLYAVDLETNRSRRVDGSASPGLGRSWLVGEEGEVKARLDNSTLTGNWNIRGTNGTIASGSNPTASVSLISIGRDGSTIIYSSRDDLDAETKWFEVAVDGSGIPREIFSDVSVERIFTDKRTGRMIGYRALDASNRLVFYDEEMRQRARNVHRAFAGYATDITDWTPNFDDVLVRISGNGDSGSHFKVDLEEMKANAVAYERDMIKPEDVGPISTFAYTASDGLELDGILTLPPRRKPSNLPLVMLPHGGPHSHDTEHFDWWAQAFASRGYAVIQPNFRGSTNRDQSFVRAGYGEWGRKMQTDLSDAVVALADAGIVDPSRACIVGASYGGYAALAGVTLQQGIYRCAVSVNGVSDLELFSRVERRQTGQSPVFSRSLDQLLGPRSEHRDRSPRFNASHADAPILLMHGRDDTVVPFEQSEKMADALNDEGKPYQFVELEGEDHWLSFAKSRIVMLRASVEFVQQHNPPDWSVKR